MHIRCASSWQGLQVHIDVTPTAGRPVPQVYVLWSEGRAAGEWEPVAYFNSPLGSKFACGLLKAAGVFLHLVRGCEARALRIRCGFYCSKLCRGAKGHTETQTQIQRHTQKPASTSLRAITDTRTHAHTHTPPHTRAHLRAYLPAVVLSDMHSVLLSDRGTWEAGAGLTPR